MNKPPNYNTHQVGSWLRTLAGPLLFLVVGLLLIAALGLAQKLGWIATTASTEEAKEKAEVEYTCPMHPEIRQPGSGRCPICAMELVPATSADSDQDEYAITVDPAARRIANIQTVAASPIALSRTIRAVGAVEYDESQLATIAAYVDGRVETLFGDYTGVKVEKGKDMVRLYSPELYAAQTEFVQSRKMLADAERDKLTRLVETQQQLVDAARRKLVELGMTESQIKSLEKSGKAETRITITSPIDGTVIEKKVVEGQYVEAQDIIYRIANLDVVWLKLKLFPEDVQFIRYGQRVAAQVQSLPGQEFDGRVAFIDPMVDSKTRTVGVRVVVENPNGKLRVGDYATARVEVPISEQGRVFDAELAGKFISPRHPQIVADKPGDCPICGIKLVPTAKLGFSKQPVAQQPALVVPRDAILKVGDQSVVYVETDPGRFELRSVELGPMTPEHAVILRGVAEGEEVATSGNFLIDSQMKLAGKPSLLDPKRAAGAPQPHMSDEPLKVDNIDVRRYADTTGEQLEALYAAYFAIQASLAADKVPQAKDVESLQQSAAALAESTELPDEARQLVETIRDESQHLAHGKIADAREHFKAVSHAIIPLAAQARGEKATKPFVHFFCSMVKGGGGDWLQSNDSLLNPYWGSEMLYCGEKERVLPTVGSPKDDKQPEAQP